MGFKDVLLFENRLRLEILFAKLYLVETIEDQTAIEGQVDETSVLG
jgi:hypothetical protein